jgi:hypothetical protein
MDDHPDKKGQPGGSNVQRTNSARNANPSKITGICLIFRQF